MSNELQQLCNDLGIPNELLYSSASSNINTMSKEIVTSETNLSEKKTRKARQKKEIPLPPVEEIILKSETLSLPSLTSLMTGLKLLHSKRVEQIEKILADAKSIK